MFAEWTMRKIHGKNLLKNVTERRIREEERERLVKKHRAQPVEEEIKVQEVGRRKGRSGKAFP